jgi:hypothetical protein
MLDMARTILSHTFLLGLMALSSGCVVHDGGGAAAREEAYRDGYYDREHNRYYHEHSWHECLEHDPYCR